MRPAATHPATHTAMHAAMHAAAHLARMHTWLALTLIAALGPAGALLPVWCWALVLGLVGLRLLSWRGDRQGLPRGMRWALSALVLSAWGWAFRGQWFSGPSVIAFFAFVLVLKWHEMSPARWRRDTLILVFGACVLGALGAVHHVVLWSLLTLPALVFAMVATLAALHGAPRPARQAFNVLAWSLPLSAVLFVTTPRVQGPLWDFGMALGLPISVSAPQGGPGLGGQARLTPGGPNRGGLEDGTVLVARFQGYRPPAAMLYWRGPVLVRFDGESWTPSEWWETRASRMAAGYRRAPAWRAQIQGRGQPLRYHLRVAAHGGHWLYALDLPAALPPESYITKDWQLLSMTPLRQESSYDALAWLDWREAAPSLDDDTRAEALAWPDAPSNPGLREWGRELAQREPTAAGRMAAALNHFAQSGFKLDPKVPAQPGPKGYDTFVFEQRAGGPEQFAASFVLMMRAAGVPARLVTGYRGGRPMGATDYVLVKQSHAHAWAEVWLPERGWVRADPADAASPMRERQRQPKPAVSGQTASPRMPPADTQRARPTPDDSGWAWLRALDGWVLHYDTDRREQLLQGLSEMRGGPLWMAMLGLLAALPPLVAWQFWRMRRTQGDRWAQAWRLLRQRLAEAGCDVGPAECPSVVSARLASRPEPWAAPAADLADRLARALYASQAVPATVLLKQVRRFRPRAFR